MSMYALQVMTGMEAEITRKLRGKGVDARCPQERRMIRRGGKWQEQLYTLFPSYIFVSTPDVYRVYYAVRHEDGVLHWLGATKGAPEALSAREEANILWLAGDGPLPPSEAEMQADGTLDFTSGPLAHLRDLLEGYCVRENHRRRGQQADGLELRGAPDSRCVRSHRGRSHGGLRFVVGLSAAARG